MLFELKEMVIILNFYIKRKKKLNFISLNGFRKKNYSKIPIKSIFLRLF